MKVVNLVAIMVIELMSPFPTSLLCLCSKSKQCYFAVVVAMPLQASLFAGVPCEAPTWLELRANDNLAHGG